MWSKTSEKIFSKFFLHIQWLKTRNKVWKMKNFPRKPNWKILTRILDLEIWAKRFREKFFFSIFLNIFFNFFYFYEILCNRSFYKLPQIFILPSIGSRQKASHSMTKIWNYKKVYFYIRTYSKIRAEELKKQKRCLNIYFLIFSLSPFYCPTDAMPAWYSLLYFFSYRSIRQNFEI